MNYIIADAPPNVKKKIMNNLQHRKKRGLQASFLLTKKTGCTIIQLKGCICNYLSTGHRLRGKERCQYPPPNLTIWRGLARKRKPRLTTLSITNATLLKNVCIGTGGRESEPAALRCVIKSSEGKERCCTRKP